MHLVDQPRTEVLLDRRRAAADPHIAPVGRGERALERRLDAVVDEVERGATLRAR